MFSRTDLQMVEIYTDGSCHSQKKTGSWVAILFVENNKVIITGMADDTTHQRMELTAVIKAIEYLQQNEPAVKHIRVITDSQYIIDLPGRKEKLSAKNYATKKGNMIQNVHLVVTLLNLFELFIVELVKVKAHQHKTNENSYNIEADKLSRKLVREAMGNGGFKSME